MDQAKRLNKTFITLFNNVLKMEEAVLKQSEIQNLSITEIHTLEAIGLGMPKTMSHVAATLKISVSTLTAAINKLVAKGYVNRFRVPEDRRMVKLELTEAGVQAVREHEAFHLAMIRDALSQVSTREAEKFIQYLDYVNEFLLMKRVNPTSNKEVALTPDRIYQGGMGVGISMSRLASAVAICGGVGIISAFQPGFAEDDYDTNPLGANIRVLQKNIKEALAAVEKAGGKGLVGINIMSMTDHYEDYVKAAIDAGAQVIVSGGGVPTSLPGICKGSDVKLIPVISSARAASVIIRNWTKKHNRTPDAVIFEGPLAGGHLGFKEEQLGPAQENFYKMIAEIKTELESFPECKLIVGGGIYSKNDALKVLACGADGVQIGSRFVTTKECDAPDSFKQAYLDCAESDLGIIKSTIGMMGRVIKNDFVEKAEKGPIPIKSCNGCLITCNRMKASFCILDALIKTAIGDTRNGLVFCGAKAYKANKIETVKDIFEEFTS